MKGINETWSITTLLLSNMIGSQPVDFQKLGFFQFLGIRL